MVFIYDALAFQNLHIQFERRIVDFLNQDNATSPLLFTFTASYNALNTSFFYGII
jgi:hypothetical protein